MIVCRNDTVMMFHMIAVKTPTIVMRNGIHHRVAMPVTRVVIAPAMIVA